MEAVLDQLTALRRHGECAAIRVQTLGGFQVWREEQLITAKEWGRDKTIQLFQFLVTARQRRGPGPATQGRRRPEGPAIPRGGHRQGPGIQGGRRRPRPETEGRRR